MFISTNKTIVSGCIIALFAFSVTAYASVSNIKNSGSAKSYQKTEELGGTSISRPGFITDEVGSSNWKPRIDLTNGTGAPSIDLRNSRGTNSQIGEEIVNGTIPKGAWMELWVGSRSYSVPTKTLPATLKPRAILLDSKRYYPSGKTGTFAIPFTSRKSTCHAYLKFNANSKAMWVSGCTGPTVSYKECKTVPNTCANCSNPGNVTTCYTRYTKAKSYFSGLSVMY